MKFVEDYRLNNTINPNTTLDEWLINGYVFINKIMLKEVTILRYKSMYKKSCSRISWKEES